MACFYCFESFKTFLKPLVSLELCVVLVFISAIKGSNVQTGDKVYYECNYSENLPFKWNASVVQFVSRASGPPASQGPSGNPPHYDPRTHHRPPAGQPGPPPSVSHQFNPMQPPPQQPHQQRPPFQPQHPSQGNFPPDGPMYRHPHNHPPHNPNFHPQQQGAPQQQGFGGPPGQFNSYQQPPGNQPNLNKSSQPSQLQDPNPGSVNFEVAKLQQAVAAANQLAHAYNPQQQGLLPGPLGTHQQNNGSNVPGQPQPNQGPNGGNGYGFINAPGTDFVVLLRARKFFIC